jgi:hypothetical protein
VFWALGPFVKMDEDLLQELSQCDYRNLVRDDKVGATGFRAFFNNVSKPCVSMGVDIHSTHTALEVPPVWRQQIVQPYSLPFWRRLFGRSGPYEVAFILGQGNKTCKSVLDDKCGYYRHMKPIRIGTLDRGYQRFHLSF